MAYRPPRHLGGNPGDPPTHPDQWIGARTSIYEPYPCTCRYAPCRYDRCPDRMRTDPQNLPDECCGSTASGTRRERTGQATPRQAAPARSGWADRPAQPPAPRRQQPRPAVAEDDLWGPPPDAHLVRWGSIDDAPPVLAALTTAPEGSSGPPRPERQSGDHLEPRRPSGRDRHCDCRTPWDAEPPLLMVADTPKAGGRVSWRQPLSRTPGADLREEAERLLAAYGYALAKPWKDGRHGLLPGAGRAKTRAGWVAPIREEAGGGVAVIDVPPEGNGVHCGDCHRNFANASAAQLHRTSWLDQCKDPASIKVVRSTKVEPGGLRSGVAIASRLVAVTYAGPMLVRGKDGIWAVDPRCPWSRIEQAPAPTGWV